MSDSDGSRSPEIGGMPMAAGSDQNSGVLAGSPVDMVVDPSYADTTLSSRDACGKQTKLLQGVSDDGDADDDGDSNYADATSVDGVTADEVAASQGDVFLEGFDGELVSEAVRDQAYDLWSRTILVASKELMISNKGFVDQEMIRQEAANYARAVAKNLEPDTLKNVRTSCIARIHDSLTVDLKKVLECSEVTEATPMEALVVATHREHPFGRLIDDGLGAFAIELFDGLTQGTHVADQIAHTGVRARTELSIAAELTASPRSASSASSGGKRAAEQMAAVAIGSSSSSEQSASFDGGKKAKNHDKGEREGIALFDPAAGGAYSSRHGEGTQIVRKKPIDDPKEREYIMRLDMAHVRRNELVDRHSEVLKQHREEQKLRDELARVQQESLRAQQESLRYQMELQNQELKHALQAKEAELQRAKARTGQRGGTKHKKGAGRGAPPDRRGGQGGGAPPRRTNPCAACNGEHFITECNDVAKLTELANDKTKAPARAPQKTDEQYAKFVQLVQGRAADRLAELKKKD